MDAVNTAQIRERQRLNTTLVLSILIHLALILGVGFAVTDKAPLVPTLDVIFSQTSTPLTPKQADFLAQANQQGGGDQDKAQRPRDSQPGVIPQEQVGIAPQTHTRNTSTRTRTNPTERHHQPLWQTTASSTANTSSRSTFTALTPPMQNVNNGMQRWHA